MNLCCYIQNLDEPPKKPRSLSWRSQMVVKMLTDRRAFYDVFVHVNLSFLSLLFAVNTITYIAVVGTKIIV